MTQTTKQARSNSRVEGSTEVSKAIIAALDEAFPDGWTYEEAAQWFNEKLPEAMKTYKQSVHNWVNGWYKPNFAFLFNVSAFYITTDPRYLLAMKLASILGMTFHA